MTLAIRGVWKTFPAPHMKPQAVLRDFDLDVAQGEFVSLIGHSGCGKSTLLNVVAGLLTPDAGEVRLDGRPVRGPGADRAMVFQNYSLLPRLSLLANVREAVRAARRDRSRTQNDELVERYLRAVGLWPHKEKRPGQVSGGMAQRAAVARAFAVSPKVLLLDEPFGALDALTRARLQQQLLELWESESETETVLMVTHGIDEAVLLADRVVVMATGDGLSIGDIIPVALARPRDRAGIVTEPGFARVQERLRGVLAAGETDAA
jgi:nitrate ABC transporter ATP-binding subunit